MWTIWSAFSASARLWVTTIRVVPRLRLTRLQPVHDLDLGLLVQIGGRLVGQEQGRCVDQRSGDNRTALLAGRHLRRIRIEVFGEAQLLQQRAALA